MFDTCTHCTKKITPFQDSMRAEQGDFHADCFAEYLLKLPAAEQWAVKLFAVGVPAQRLIAEDDQQMAS